MPVASHRLGYAMRMVLALGVIALMPVVTALAQDGGHKATARKPYRLKPVTVTGSRIRSVDIENQQPIFSISQQDIRKTGLATVGDIMQRIVSMGTPGFNRSSIRIDFQQGGSYVNMRGLGANRVLVLVNGKRWVSGIRGVVDISTIPSALIQRVDVLKDGASLIYGSDAITGVVNFILKNHFKGAQAHVYDGQNQQGDGATMQYDFTAGAHTDKSLLMFSASYTKQGTVWAKSRPQTATPSGPNHPQDYSIWGPWGSFMDPRPPDTKGAGKRDKYGNWVPNRWVLNHSGNQGLGLGKGQDSRSWGDYHVYHDDPADGYNYAYQTMWRQPLTLKSIFTHISHAISDTISLQATAMYADRGSTMQMSSYPEDSTAQPTYPVRIDADSYYNPVAGKDLEFHRRVIELPRIMHNDFQSLHADVGLQGWFDIGQREWNWDVSAIYNRGNGLLSTSGQLNLPALKKALGPSFMNNHGVVQCGSTADPIPLGINFSAGQCTPFNILGGPSASTPQALKYINTLTKETYAIQTYDYNANIAGGLFDLQGGEFSVAAGLESRSESGDDRPDLINQSGLTTHLAANATSGRYHVNEAYVELSAPLLRDLPGARQLTLGLASRYSRYSNFGGTINNKYSFAWKPIDDVLVRGNYAQGFRAPTISDLFGGGSQHYPTFIDPCDSRFGAAATDAGVAARFAARGVPADYRQLDLDRNPIKSHAGGHISKPFISGVGNASLQPETSITRTLGLVYSPYQWPGLNISLDGYHIRIDNAISTVGPNDVLDNCYINQSSKYCAAFSRDKSNYQIVALHDGKDNIGYVDTSGYDLALNYRLPLSDYGQFTTRLQSTYISSYSQQASKGAVVAELVGQQGIYRLRSHLRLNWWQGAWGASWTLRYFSALRDVCFNHAECNQPQYTSPSWKGKGANRKGAIAFNDLQLRWHAPWNADTAVGVNNLFNRKADPYYSASHTFASYNPAMDIDRYFYASYTQKF